MTRQEFLFNLLKLVETNASKQELSRLITDYGSETPDNVTAAKQLDLIEQNNYCGIGSHNHLLSDVLNTLECTEIPAHIKKQFTDLSQSEWEALMRVATLICSAFDCPLK